MAARKKHRSTREAIEKVLRESGEPMTAKDIYAVIRRRRLAPGLKGKTPVATISARLSTGDEFERVGKGTYRLREE